MTKEEFREYQKVWKKKNPRKVQNHKLTASYGISVEVYDAMLKAQGGACAICGTTEPGDRKKWFSVDHEHTETQHIRGLLCTRCNIGLGYFKDDPKIIQSAARYLAALNFGKITHGS